MKNTLPFAAAICGAALATPAEAATQVIDFKVTGGSFFQFFGNGTPYGLPAQPTLTGSLSFDNTRSDSSAFTAFNLVAGSRTFSLADVKEQSSIYYENGTFAFFFVKLDEYTNIGSFNSFVISDDARGIGCNGCVSITSNVVVDAVPEPATWAMFLIGFGMIGAVPRYRRRSTATTFA